MELEDLKKHEITQIIKIIIYLNINNSENFANKANLG